MFPTIVHICPNPLIVMLVFFSNVPRGWFGQKMPTTIEPARQDRLEQVSAWSHNLLKS